MGMIFFAQPILELLFPNQPEGTLLLQISAISIVFIMINQNVNAVLHGLGKTILPTIILIIGIIIKVILNTIFLNIDPNEFILGGVAGAAFANTICYIVVFLIGLIIMKKNIKIKIGIKRILKTIIASSIMIIVLIYTYNNLLSILSEKMCILISLLVAIFTYIIGLILQRVFSKDEILLLPKGEKIYNLLKFLKIY